MAENQTSDKPGSQKKRGKKLIRTIAVFKFLKFALLILVGAVALKLVHHDRVTEIVEKFKDWHVNPDGKLPQKLLAKISGVSDKQLTAIGFGVFAYASLFFIEGVGLWMLKRWAEWFTVITTSLLIPFEAYEIVRHASAGRIIALCANVLIAAYLLVRVIKDGRESKRERAAQAN